MLRFTKQVDYGLMAMEYIAEHQRDGLIGVRCIAAAFGIPTERLAKILQRLARAGLVVSHGGRHGGYRLPRPSSDVTLGDVIRVLDGPIAIVSCMANHDCPQMPRCSVRQPAGKIEAAITQMLDAMTLADLMDDGVPAPAVVSARGQEEDAQRS